MGDFPIFMLGADGRTRWMWETAVTTNFTPSKPRKIVNLDAAKTPPANSFFEPNSGIIWAEKNPFPEQSHPSWRGLFFVKGYPVRKAKPTESLEVSFGNWNHKYGRYQPGDA
ncbi:MAG: hypothetical protein P8183_08800 [Anaerolineae bacterium]